MRRIRRLLLCLAGCAVLPCCQPRRSSRESDPVEVLVGTEPATLDPRYATRGLDLKLTRLLHAGLVRLDSDTLLPKPNLALSIVRRGNREIVVQLDPSARFHSGKPLEARDVCATIQAIRDPKLSSPHRSIVESIESCWSTGSHSLELTLSGPRATWMSDLEMPILRADEANLPPRNDGRLDGLGPFRLRANQTGVLHLVPSEGFKQPPRFPIVIRTIHDENARAMRLISGRSEIACNAFSPSLLSGFTMHAGLSVNTRPGANITYLLTRSDRPPFDQPEARRALSLAIDRESVVKYLLAGKAQPAKWLIPEGHWAAPKDLRPLAFDPAQARPLLSALPPVTLLTSTDRSRVIQARAVAQMLADAGLQTQVIPLELGLLLARLDAGQFTLAILQIPELTEPNVLSWFFHPRGIVEDHGGPTLGKNRARYRSTEAARLLDAASASFDPEQRRSLYVQLAAQMLQDMPVVPLWHEDHVTVARGRGALFSPSAEGRWSALAEL